MDITYVKQTFGQWYGIGFVLANGSMNSNTSDEGDIIQQIINNDLYDCLARATFLHHVIPVCLWFLTRNKTQQTFTNERGSNRNRTGETLFIDARNLGSMIDCVHKRSP